MTTATTAAAAAAVGFLYCFHSFLFRAAVLTFTFTLLIAGAAVFTALCLTFTAISGALFYCPLTGTFLFGTVFRITVIAAGK